MEVVALKNSHGGPDHLSEEAKSWWARLVEEFQLEDDAAHLLLQTALEAFDRMRGCQSAIERDGATVPDRFGQHKPHPLLAAERDSRAQMLAALKALNLDLEPLRDAGK
jgi:P27 family predicted phage terminase small subunit